MADSSALQEELKYQCALHFNVSNFVSVKLSGKANYGVWKAQMICLMETHKMGGIVDIAEFDTTTTLYSLKQYDNLLKGWIFGSLNEDVLTTVADLKSARDVWEKLKFFYGFRQDAEIFEYTESSTEDRIRNRSVKMEDSFARIQELRYLYASNVNVSNFVSEKLSTEDNYHIWKAQIVCLLETQNMHGLVDNRYDGPGEMTDEIEIKYEYLIKGWILGSLSHDVLKIAVNLGSATNIWLNLEHKYDPQRKEARDLASKYYGFTQTEMKIITKIENRDNTKRNSQLVKATVEGRWWEAESILKKDKHAATEAITNDGNTMLHLAVGIGQNYFVKELLDFIDDDDKEIEKKNSCGRTALNVAAIVGNTYAAKLLVEKRRELLGIADHKAIVPLLNAYYNIKLDTFAYLLGVAEIMGQPSSTGFFPHSDLPSRVDHLITLIFTRQYDLASTWVNRYPELVKRNDQVLMAMVKTFPSELGFGEALIYPRLYNVPPKLFKRCSLLFHSYEFVYAIAKHLLWAQRKSKNTCCYSWLLSEIVKILLVPAAMFYLIYQFICLFILGVFYSFLVLYFIMWKVLAIVVTPIKRINKKKKDYIKAKMLLKLVCDHIDDLNLCGSSHPCYTRPILEAAYHGFHDVVDEILHRSPLTISCKNQNDHNIIQLAVINRSEKVYNCICHFIERIDLSRKDSSKNNILHLAGRLAPSFVLSSTTGAAIQLQRELQWRKEVEKFMSPTELVEENINKETPEMVFTREHKALMNEGEKWMKTTAESCSITAALITTIVFAAAITVPGGSNQETGIPLFRKEIAFTVFAVSDAISLFASSTALLVFLSILTAVRFSEEDFLVSLPRRMIIGLCSLILSTIALMVAFSAILFLVFCDKRAWMVAPIGGLACFPIAIIVTLEFPLVVDLYLSTYCPILLADCTRSNMKNMRSSLAKMII